jgi:hypothetical protein
MSQIEQQGLAAVIEQGAADPVIERAHSGPHGPGQLRPMYASTAQATTTVATTPKITPQTNGLMAGLYTH